MRKFRVSLDVYSKALRLSDLARAIGVPENKYSRDIGSRITKNKYCERSVLCIDSGLPKTAAVADHLDALAKQLPETLRNGVGIPDDVEIFLNVGVFVFEEFEATVLIPTSWIGLASKMGMKIAVTIYPLHSTPSEASGNG